MDPIGSVSLNVSEGFVETAPASLNEMKSSLLHFNRAEADEPAALWTSALGTERSSDLLGRCLVVVISDILPPPELRGGRSTNTWKEL